MIRREQLLQTALSLFSSDGFKATSVDKILSESGVSKPTLYRYFNSKDELIIAALSDWEVTLRASLVDVMQRDGEEPRARLLALFDQLQTWFDSSDFNGCLLIKAILEFPTDDGRILQLAEDHKQALSAAIRDIVALGGAKDPGELTADLILLIDGATIQAQAYYKRDAGRRAHALAAGLLDQAGITS